jgi:hypothetical protein
MKKALLIAAALAATTLAVRPAEAYDAIADGWSPGRIACIRAAGYQPVDWHNRTVPPGPAAQYRACRAKADAREGRK